MKALPVRDSYVNDANYFVLIMIYSVYTLKKVSIV